MKRLARFLFERWYGAFVFAGVTAAAILLTPWVVDTEKEFAWLLVGEWYAMGAAGLVAVAAFFSFLFRRQWKDSAKLFFAALGFAFVFLLGIGVCLFTGKECLPNLANWMCEPPKDNPWRTSAMSMQIPFSIEFRNAHAFLAEYERRVCFRSGKRRDLITDTGGGEEIAVYAIRAGEFLLIDRRGNRYCVNVVRETVETSNASPESGRYVGCIDPSAKVSLGGTPPK